MFLILSSLSQWFGIVINTLDFRDAVSSLCCDYCGLVRLFIVLAEPTNMCYVEFGVFF